MTLLHCVWETMQCGGLVLRFMARQSWLMLERVRPISWLGQFDGELSVLLDSLKGVQGLLVRVVLCFLLWNSIEELNRIQRSLPGIENLVIPLRDYCSYKSWLKRRISFMKDKEWL